MAVVNPDKSYSITDPETGLVGTIEPTSMHPNPSEFEPVVSNGALVFEGDSVLRFASEVGDDPEMEYSATAYLNHDDDSFTFYGTIIEVEYYGIYFLPYDGTSIVSSIQGFMTGGPPPNYETAPEQYVLFTIDSQSGETYFVDALVSNHEWHDYSIVIKDGTWSMKLDGLDKELIGLTQPEPVASIEFPYDWYFEVKWCENTYAKVSSFSVSSVGGDIIDPYDYFVDYPYLSFYTIRTCSSECPSATSSPTGYNVPSKACSFKAGDESPVWDETYVQTIIGDSETIVVDESAWGTSRTFYWQRIVDSNGAALQARRVFVTRADGASIDIYDDPSSSSAIEGSVVETDAAGAFSFWCDSTKKVSMRVYVLDAVVGSSTFECEWYVNTGDSFSQCMPDIPLLVLKTRCVEGGIADSSGTCVINEDGTTTCSFCPLTSLTSMQSDYPSDSSVASGNILSTHYKVEISLNDEPLSGDEILSQALSKNAYSMFEDARPVTRVAHYHLKLDHAVDFSGNPIPLYEDYYNYTAAWVSRYVRSVELIEGGEAAVFGTSTNPAAETWTINHALASTEIMCQCFDESGAMMYPDAQYALDQNNYVVEWPEETGGTAVVCIANYYEEVDDSKLSWMISHGLAIYESPMIVQVFEPETIEREEPASIEQRDQGLSSIEVGYDQAAGAVGFASVDETYNFAASKTWTVDHTLGVSGVMVQAYDTEWSAIVPESVVIESDSRIVIKFATPTAGRVGLKKIGNPTWRADAVASLVDGAGVPTGTLVISDLSGLDSIDMKHGSSYADRSYDVETEGEKTMQGSVFYSVPLSEVYDDEDNYYFKATFKADDLDDVTINEMAVYNEAGDMILYSVGSSIYKPSEMYLDVTYALSKKELNTQYV